MENSMSINVNIVFTGELDELAFRMAVREAITAMTERAAAKGIGHLNEVVTIEQTCFGGVLTNKYGSFDLGAAIKSAE